MLSISNPKRGGSGGGYYFKYYTEHSVQNPKWAGTGASLLNLPEFVERDHFDNLLNGYSPDGKFKLVQNAGADSRQGFWDLTFSVPKAVSVLWAGATEEVRSQLDAAIENSVLATLRQIEEAAGFSRRGKGGSQIVPAALTFALFQHISSRAEDPQVHWHCVLVNVGVREDGTTGALYTERLFQEKMNAGSFFQAQLIHELESRFGLKIEKEAVGFHIAGVPKELCNVFSKRREEIVEVLNRTGKRDAKAAKAAAIETRGKKKHTKRAELLTLWGKTAQEFGFGPEKVHELLQKGLLRKMEVRADQSHEQSSAETEKRTDAGGSFGRKKDEPKRADREEDKGSLTAFEKELRSATDRIFPENQTRPRILRVAAQIGKKHGIDPKTQARAVGKLQLPIHRRFYRIEWRPLFPKAPQWSVVRQIRAPRVVVRNRPRRWSKIVWDRPLWRLGKPTAAIRLQERRLFPKAPGWSPLSKLALPALRLGAVRKQEKPREMEQSR